MDTRSILVLLFVCMVGGLGIKAYSAAANLMAKAQTNNQLVRY